MCTVSTRLFSVSAVITRVALAAVSLLVVASHSANAEEAKEEEVKNEAEVKEKTTSDKHKTSPRRDTKHVGQVAALEPDPRGRPDLTVCSQNLKLFGTLGVMQRRDPKVTSKIYALKKQELVERFIAAKCDVIGVQEIVGGNATETENAMKELVNELRAQTNRFFEYRIAPPAEGKMTIGFLVATDRAEISHTLSYSRVELPRIQKKQRPRVFSRTPLEIQLAVKSREGDVVKNVSVINFHFKSKRGGEGDPTGLEKHIAWRWLRPYEGLLRFDTKTPSLRDGRFCLSLGIEIVTSMWRRRAFLRDHLPCRASRRTVRVG